jgi:hypothetical protein
MQMKQARDRQALRWRSDSRSRSSQLGGCFDRVGGPATSENGLELGMWTVSPKSHAWSQTSHHHEYHSLCRPGGRHSWLTP